MNGDITADKRSNTDKVLVDTETTLLGVTAKITYIISSKLKLGKKQFSRENMIHLGGSACISWPQTITQTLFPYLWDALYGCDPAKQRPFDFEDVTQNIAREA